MDQGFVQVQKEVKPLEFLKVAFSVNQFHRHIKVLMMLLCMFKLKLIVKVSFKPSNCLQCQEWIKCLDLLTICMSDKILLIVLWF